MGTNYERLFTKAACQSIYEQYMKGTPLSQLTQAKANGVHDASVMTLRKYLLKHGFKLKETKGKPTPQPHQHVVVNPTKLLDPETRMAKQQRLTHRAKVVAIGEAMAAKRHRRLMQLRQDPRYVHLSTKEIATHLWQTEGGETLSEQEQIQVLALLEG